jgi:hypothetical protein
MLFHLSALCVPSRPFNRYAQQELFLAAKERREHKDEDWSSEFK